MAETIFPQSPNWFLTRIMSAREDGSVAYGSQNGIFILKNEENKIQPVLLREAHNERVTSVTFSPAKCNSKFVNSIMSSSEDGYVKLWNTETLMPLIGHKSHWEKEETSPVKVVCADWSQYNPQYIVSAADNNTLVLWDTIANMTTRFYVQKLKPTVIACSNHDEKIVACGSMSGLVYIVKLIKKGEIMYKLRGHDKEVQALSWCPISESCDISKQFLLASSCQEKEIYIWRASDGACETKIPLPRNALSKNSDQGKWEQHTTIHFIPLFWAEPYTLYSGTKYGELISCDLKDILIIHSKNGGMTEKQFNRKTANCWKLIHSLHTNVVMAITGLQTKHRKNSKDCDGNKSLEDNNENHTVNDYDGDLENNSTNKNLIWTSGRDQRLIAIHGDTETNHLKFNFHTLNGHPYYAAVSPHDPNKIALASGDGKIRLWSSARSSGNTRIYWQKIKDRVYALAWHPTREGLLAFGTSEGRVGLLEMYSLKQAVNFKAHHHGVVYRLSWGPSYLENEVNPSSEEKEYCLYSVGNNNIFLLDPKKIYSEPLNLSRIVNLPSKKFTDLSWKPDYSLLAVGCGNGNIYLLQPPKLTLYQVVHDSKKYIQSLTWHPMSTTVDTDCSSFQGYLTCGSTDTESTIKVYNCTINEKCTVDHVAVLRGHSSYVQAVSWSPHIAGRLISASADFSVRIWDVTKNMQISKFIVCQSVIPLFCIWNPVDPDVLIAGIADKMAFSWRISNRESNKDPIIKDSKLNKGKSIELSESVKSFESPAENCSKGNVESQKLEIINFPLANQEQKTLKESKIFVKAWKYDKDPFKRCYDLLKRNEIDRDDEDCILPLLGSEKQFSEFLNSEAESFQKSNKWNEYYEMSLWRGNLNEVIEEKIKSGHLDDFLVSLAPFASPRLWKEACISYAKSLAEKKLHRKAACYLMAVHEVREAIDLLLKADLYLEAISIARCRLPESDPVFSSIVRKYGDWLTENGAYLKASECYIFLNEFAEAAAVLGKKNHVDYLSLAALASRKAGVENLEREYSFNALLLCMESLNLDLASRICSDHENLKHLSVLHIIHREIIQIDSDEVILEKDLLNYFWELTEIREDPNVYAALEYIYDRNFLYFDKKKLHVTLAQELALACCAVDKETMLTHIIKSLNAAARWINKSSDVANPLYKLCSWLCSNEYLAKGKIFCSYDEITKPKIISLRAFLCLGLVEYLDNAYSQNNEDLLDELLHIELVLVELINDALDRETFIYFKNQLDVILCEKTINEAYIKKNGLINETTENGSGLNVASYEPDEKLNYGQVSEESENDFNKLIVSEKEKMSVLKSKIQDFENSRIIAPNPALVYCALRRVSNASRNPQCNLKQIVDEKWSELEKL